MKKHSDTTPTTHALTLEIENLRLKEEVRELRSVLREDMTALKESTRLLRRSKPPRPHISSEKKLLIAGEQLFQCAGDRARCPMWRLNGGNFDATGFEIDHIDDWHRSYRSDRRVLQALCHSCHALKTRMARIAELEQKGEVSADDDE